VLLLLALVLLGQMELVVQEDVQQLKDFKPELVHPQAAVMKLNVFQTLLVLHLHLLPLLIL